MTLQASFPISANDINTELNRTTGSAFNMTGTREMALAQVTSGALSMSSFLNRSLITQTDTRTTATTSHATVNFGVDNGAERWIAILAWHGNTATNPGQTPTATIGGVSATLIAAHSDGNGSSTACGVALFVAQPSGTNGTVAVSWGGLPVTIIAIRVIGYSLSSAYSSGAVGAATTSLSINIPTNGFLIGACQKVNTGTITWTNLSKIGDEIANSEQRSWGWNYPLGLQTGRNVSYSPNNTSQGFEVLLVASFNPS